MLLLLAMLSLAYEGNGQQALVEFGRNRMQYDEFNWRFYSSANFDIYFYGKGEKSALEVTNYIEKEFARITEVIGYSPYFKTKIFLYNSISDLQQSNIGVNDQDPNAGGQTNFIKSYVEVANPGSIEGLKKELVSAVSELVIKDMMFGGSLTDMWQNSFLMNLPDWFVSGASAYLANGWDVTMDDEIRDLISSKKVKKLNRLTGRQAVVAGQSMWNFIVEKYGKSNLNQILNLVRVTRNEEKSISFTLGISFKQVMLEWEQFYTNMLVDVSQHYVQPDHSLRQDRLKSDEQISAIALNPSGNRLAYAINVQGKFFVRLINLETGKNEKVLTGGYKVINQEVNRIMPLLNWSDDKTLGIISYEKAENVLWLYDVETKSKLVAPLRNFDQISSFDFSGNGRLAVLSASRHGKTDIFLLSVRRNKVRRLTNDHFDNITPHFIPGTNTILFSSNRTTDSLQVDETSIGKLTENFNLFTFNLDTTRNVVARITNTISKDYSPIARDQTTFYYLSDQKGIINLFKYDLKDSLYSQVTNFSQNIRQYDLNFSNSSLSYSMISDLRLGVYLKTGVNFDQNNFTPPTPRQQKIQAKFLMEKRLVDASRERSRELPISLGSKKDNEQPLDNKKEVHKIDTLVVQSETTSVVSVDTSKAVSPDSTITTPLDSIDNQKDVPTNEETKTDTDIINTDDYVFDKEVTQKVEKSQSFLTNYRRSIKEPEPLGPLPYEQRFSANNMVTSWVVDPIRGFGMLLQIEMNDMLENHKFRGGLMATYDLKSGEVFAEYQYLKYLIDYGVKFDRNVWLINSGDDLKQRYSKNVFDVAASLPFSPKSRLSVRPFFEMTRYQDLNFFNLIPNTPAVESNTTTYLGLKTNYVYDNSRVTGLNMMEGTRLKIEYQHHEGISNKSRSFDKFTFDVRHYQKLHRTLVLAGRAYYGKFFGRFHHNFLLGGMDNWMFSNRIASSTPYFPEVSKENNELYFSEFVTSVRGFDFNTFHGTDVLLFNLELRLPVAGFFSNAPVRSTFLRNLQFVGFLDVGSAWTGASPFSSDNNISTVVRGDNVFQAEIKTFRSPWLTGYGTGLRSVMFGYYMKFDLAWPIEDNRAGSSKFYVSLGHDF